MAKVLPLSEYKLATEEAWGRYIQAVANKSPNADRLKQEHGAMKRAYEREMEARANDE